MKNLIIRFILFLVLPFQKKGNGKNRCLIISTTGLGDTLWASGVLYAMKLKQPKISIDCITTTIGSSLLQTHKALSQIFILKNSRFFSFLSLFFRLRKNRYESVLIFHASQRLIYPLVKLLNPGRIISSQVDVKGLESLIDEQTPFDHIHEIERRYLIAEKWTGPLKRIPLNCHITQKQEQETKQKLLQYCGVGSSYIMLQPGAKDPFKCWPLAYFDQLLTKLLATFSHPILLTGNEKECAMLQTLIRPQVFSLANTFSLDEVNSLIKNASLFITNDTGPMHIAFSHQTPTIALFSPTNPNTCGPFLTKNYKILYKPPTCRPCIKKKCQDPFCMRQITVDEVLLAAKEMLCMSLS